MENFTNKRIAIIGMARSGLAAARVLAARGGVVTLYDSGPAEKLGAALEQAASAGVEARHSTDRVGDADLVITSPGVRKNAPVLLDAQARGIPIWGEIEAAYRVSKAPILAITGTNGKTTTTALLGEMARADGRETYVAGNIAAGEIAMPLVAAADAASKDALIVAEISSFQLEWTPSFRPRVAAILNIGVDHFDRQAWDEYVAAKWNIAAHQGQGDTLVLRSDVTAPTGVGALNPRCDLVYFDREPRPDWLDRILLPGEHNIENVLAALCMARAAGIGDAAIEKAATTFSGVVHRLELVAEIAGVRYINNSMCTNNVAFARSLDAVPGPKIVLTGGVYKGGDMADLIEAAAKNPQIRQIVFFGRSGDELETAVRGAGFDRTVRVTSLADAFTAATGAAKRGDTVLLNPACASFDQFRDFEDRGDQFKQLVRSHAAQIEAQQ